MHNIDNRTRKQIVEQIREKSQSYVPEWRFEEDHPDIGTAVALVFSDMFSKTLKRFNQTPQKNRIAFLNELDAKLLPAVPATGFVTFSLVNHEVQGVEVGAGVVVNARTDEEESGVIPYRTVDDVYVTPARLSDLYHTCGRSDYICRLWEGEGTPEKLTFFDLKGVNLQEHELYFSHSQALCIETQGWIQLDFSGIGEGGGAGIPEKLLERLSDPDCVRFEYYAQDGYQEFREQKRQGGKLIFYKGADQPGFQWTEMEGTEGYFIRCKALDIEELKELEFSRLSIRSYGADLEPESVYAGGTESGKKRCFPFGERLTNYSEVYFASKEALCKKGAIVELAFHLDFAKIPLDFNMENDPVKWEWIMKRSDFKPDPEYDITVESVIWEYYNGLGWARLFPDDRYADLFYPGEKGYGTYKKIRFACPEDISPLTVNSCESYYIRARVVKVNNFYKMKGAYISPVLENTVFQYDYEGREVVPECVVAKNNLEFQKLVPASGSQPVGKRPFLQVDDERQVLYFGFDKAPVHGPIKLFFLLKDNVDRRSAMLLWEYFDGLKWRELNLVDETQNFGKTGLVTLMGGHDFEKKRLFGKERYWFRIIDTKDAYRQRTRTGILPAVEGIYLNTTKVINMDEEAVEYFRMEIYQENMRFPLLSGRLAEARVYVNEAEGQEDAWVQWESVEDFVNCGPEDRVYVMDRNEGYVVFGNGKNGRIPPSSGRENIRVHYRRGGGERGNVQAGRIDQMNQEMGFINRVSNPVALTGGCDMESLSDALQRNGAAIRHQNRAVTVRDFEELAMAACRSIRRVKCYAGYDGQGKRSPGAVTLVVIQKNYESGKIRFDDIKELILTHLADKAAGDLLSGGRLFIIEPEFVHLNVRAELMARDFNQVFQVKKQVQEKLTRFLDPFSGNYHGQGWEIGQIPGNIQIKNAVADTPGVAVVKNIYISAYSDESLNKKEIDLEKGQRGRYILPVNGIHEVVIHVG